MMPSLPSPPQSGNKGFGLFANSEIPAGTFIVEYLGESIDAEECEQRMIRRNKQGQADLYYMTVDENEVPMPLDLSIYLSIHLSISTCPYFSFSSLSLSLSLSLSHSVCQLLP